MDQPEQHPPEATVAGPEECSSAAASLPQVLVQSAHQLGTALTCLAVTTACNNASCTNLSGPSEAQLVGGRSCVCGGCRTARFCCRGCQLQAWAQHKPLCGALRAAAAVQACEGAALSEV